MTTARNRGPLFARFVPAVEPDASLSDGELTPYGLDCCDASRQLTYLGLRWFWGMGECLECEAPDDDDQPRDCARLQPAGWIGAVKRPPSPGMEET